MYIYFLGHHHNSSRCILYSLFWSTRIVLILKDILLIRSHFKEMPDSEQPRKQEKAKTSAQQWCPFLFSIGYILLKSALKWNVYELAFFSPLLSVASLRLLLNCCNCNFPSRWPKKHLHSTHTLVTGGRGMIIWSKRMDERNVSNIN